MGGDYSFSGGASELSGFSYSGSLMKTQLETSKPLSSLYDIAEAVFAANPKSLSIRFEPVLFYPCNVSKHIEHIPYNAIEYPDHVNLSSIPTTTSTVLPRLGVWDVSEPFKRNFECKLIMRTIAVGMYYVHFESLIESGPWKPVRLRDVSTITYPLTHLALLHYKYPPEPSDNILEGFPPTSEESFYGATCRRLRRRARNRYNYQYHAQISQEIARRLKDNYRTRTRTN